MSDLPIIVEPNQLWDDCRSGSRQAFSQLYDLFAADLYRYGYNLVRNKLLVEDRLYGLFVHMQQQRERLDATDNIRVYLYRALRRRLLDPVVRLNKPDSDAGSLNGDAFVIQADESLLMTKRMAGHQKQMMLNELNRLPKQQKEVLYLVYMKGLTCVQTADVMDISQKSVYEAINTGLMNLPASVVEVV